MITSWSPSKLEKYEACPLKCKLETVDKLCPKCFAGALKGWDNPTCTKCGGGPDPSPVLQRGTMLHKEAEDFITGKKAMHNDLKPVAEWLTTYRKGHAKGFVRVEQQVAVDRDWKEVEWFSPKAWLRTKIDVLDLTGKLKWKVADWKTGKFKPDGEYSDQLNIYSTVVLSAFPQPKTVTSTLVFIDAGRGVERPEGEVKRKDLPKAQKRWVDRAKAMLTDEIFPPKPSFSCRWCPFSKGSGGPCPF